MKIGLIVAMDSEFASLRASLGGMEEGRFPGSENDVVLMQCGIGKVNAAVGTISMIRDHHPDCIISTGLAGGVAGAVDVWDAVVADHTAYHDVWCGMGNKPGQVQGLPQQFTSSEALVDAAMSLESTTDTHFHKGLICTGDQFITDPDAIGEIVKKFPDTLACDMESAAIAHVCHLQGVPFASIRIISDTPGRTSDHAMQWEQSLAHMSAQSFQIINKLIGILKGENL